MISVSTIYSSMCCLHLSFQLLSYVKTQCVNRKKPVVILLFDSSLVPLDSKMKQGMSEIFLTLQKNLKYKKQNPTTYYGFKEALDTGSYLSVVFPSPSDEPSCVPQSYWNFFNTQYKEGTCMELRKDTESRTLACSDGSCGQFLEIYFSRLESVCFSKTSIITVLAEPALRINSIIS